MSRRLGNKRHEKTPQQLLSLHRPEIDGLASNLISNGPPGVARSQISKVSDQDESFIFAEPLSEDEEDLDCVNLPRSSDEEDIGRGDIRPTDFNSRRNIRNRSINCVTSDGVLASIKDNISARSRGSEAKSPTRYSRRNGSESTNSASKRAKLETVHKVKELDIFSIVHSKARAKPIKKYGSQNKSQGSRGSQSNDESPSDAILKKPSEAKLELLESPEKRFKIPEVITAEQPDFEAGRVFKTFDLPVYSPESQFKMPEFRLGPDLSDLPDIEESTPVFRTLDVIELLKQSGPAQKDLTDRVPLRELENGEDIQSQQHVFRMPSMVPEAPGAPGALDIVLTSQSRSEELDSLEDSSLETNPLSSHGVPEAACPMCGEPVDSMFLKGYNDGKRMNIRTQTKFCRAHRKKSARIEWAEKGYPTIDWTGFDTRLTQHHSYLKSLLDGESSYYRNVLAEQVRSGKDRTLLQAISNSENSLMPGYYGPRGFRAMSENVIDSFSSQLRRIAVTDRLVAARGVTGYVQNVLVPELAVRLICEDMSLGVEESRQIMRESISLGDLLNEEVEDVVTWKEGDDTL